MDIADQLQGNYRPGRWMQQRKWWWVFFIWAIGVAGVNAYCIYKVIYDKEDSKKMLGLRKVFGRTCVRLHFPREIYK
jgi:hypothetical protein